LWHFIILGMNILTSKPFDYQAAVQYQLRYLMMQDSAEYDFDIS